MSLRIHTNVESMFIRSQLARHDATHQSALRQLSSGLRIVTAADDAAGLAMSERMRASIRSLGQASRNLQDGLSLAQTADAALQETSNLLSRLREIAIQAQNGTLSAADRDILDRERAALVSELDRIARQTRWGARSLLDGSALRIRIQAGASADSALWLELGDATASGLRVRGIQLDTVDHAARAVAAIDQARTRLDELRGRLAAGTHRLQSAWNSAQTERESLVSAESRIRDVDVAEATSELVRSQILRESSVSVLRQANLQPVLALLLLEPPEH